MTIATTTSRVVAQGNGATTSFSYNFLIPSSSDVSVTFVDAGGVQTPLTAGQYSISGLGVPSGGTVTYPLSGSPLATGQSLVIQRVMPLKQLTRLTNQGNYFPDVVEGAMDALQMQIQQVSDQVSRSLQVSITDTTLSNLPPAAQRAGLVLGFDANGNSTLLTPIPQGIYPPSFVNATTVGADGKGLVDSLAGLMAAAALSCAVFLPQVTSSYLLSAEWKPPAQDMTFQAAANVSFTGAHPNFNNLIPYEASPGPLWSQFLISKTYGSQWAGQGNVFQIGSYAKVTISGPPVVAVYGQGEAAGAGSRAWGMNPAGVASNATGTAIAIEVDPVVTVAGGTAYAVVVASSSNGQAGGVFPNGFQMDANDYNARFLDGLYFHFSETIASGDVNPRGLLNGNVINIGGGGGTGSVCQALLKSSGVSTTSATIDFPALLVDACTVTTVANRLRVTVGTTGVGPGIRPAGTDTNCDLNISSKGTGAVTILDGLSNQKFVANQTGIGLLGAAAKARVTGWSTPTGAAIVASFNGASATLVNCSNAIAQIISDLKGFGLYGA